MLVDFLGLGCLYLEVVRRVCLTHYWDLLNWQTLHCEEVGG